jgi:hypothetical protein
MNGWQIDKRWSDRFLPEIKRILGEILLSEPPIEEDQMRCTDLIVLKMDAVRIACRVRKHKYIEKYGDQFTIRASRPSGVETELTKIVSGWGNYMFYGFSNQAEAALCQWIVGDLNRFRLWFNRELYQQRKPGIKCNNGDSSSDFIAFNSCDIPGFIVKASKKGGQQCEQ